MLTKINLLIYLAVWRRPEITRLCFLGINRLRRHPKYNIQVLAVISEPEMISLCESHDIKWVMHQNYPLGKKKNYGLNICKEYEFDWLMEIGSDDIITDAMLDHYYQKFSQYKFFGITDMAYIESESGVCRRLTSHQSTYGAGRCISREILEKAEWKLWKEDLNRGLDNDSTRKINKLGYSYHKVEPMEDPGLIDVKSNENIWKFNYFLGQSYDPTKLLMSLSKAELNCLNSLQNAGA